MKNNFFNLLAFSALLIFFSSCEKVVLDAGSLTEEVREIDEEFTKIQIDGSLDLLINQDDSDDILRVEAGTNLLEHIETYVQNGTLYIDEESNNFFTSGVRRIYVTKQMLESITMKGSGDLEADQILASDFNLEMKGSGDSDIEFDTLTHMNVSMDGSGDCELKGEAETFTLGLNGSGDCHARFLLVSQAIVNLNGSGDIQVFSNNDLTININGSGDVDYWGAPENTLFNVNGSGDINNH